MLYWIDYHRRSRPRIITWAPGTYSWSPEHLYELFFISLSIEYECLEFLQIFFNSSQRFLSAVACINTLLIKIMYNSYLPLLGEGGGGIPQIFDFRGPNVYLHCKPTCNFWTQCFYFYKGKCVNALYDHFTFRCEMSHYICDPTISVSYLLWLLIKVG